MRAKPGCVRATFDDCGGAALVSWTFATGLRVSPSLAAAGFQEMRPALALDIASKGDAITGINRADTASVENYSMSGDSLLDGKAIFGSLHESRRLAFVTHAALQKFRKSRRRVRARFSLVVSWWRARLLGQETSALLTDSHWNGWDRQLVGLWSHSFFAEAVAQIHGPMSASKMLWC